jgi:hypothetical protein
MAEGHAVSRPFNETCRSLQGHTQRSRDPALLALNGESDFVVKITVRAVFRNFPRYVRRHGKVSGSRYIPTLAEPAPLATWKLIDDIQALLPERNAEKVAAAGRTMPDEDLIGMIVAGDPGA